MLSLPLVRHALVSGVRGIFNDRTRGQQPVARSQHALFEPGSVIWRVHGDVTTMMVGGVAALLLQMLHPAALAGVWDHSTFRDDMLGRLRRTARFIAVTTFGEASEAAAAIAQVRDVHSRIHGTLPNGAPYTASDPHLLAWVHVTEAVSFLDAWILYGDPDMSLADQDRYFKEFAQIARALGAEPVPESRAEAETLIASIRPELVANERTREVARKVLEQRPPSFVVGPVQALVMRAAIDLLPDWARRMHRRHGSGPGRPLVHGITSGVAGTLRWAFAGTTR